MCFRENPNVMYRNALKIIQEDDDLVEREQPGNAPVIVRNIMSEYIEDQDDDQDAEPGG